MLVVVMLKVLFFEFSVALEDLEFLFMTIGICLVPEAILNLHNPQLYYVQQIPLFVSLYRSVTVFFGSSFVDLSLFGSFGLVFEFVNLVGVFVFYVCVQGGVGLVDFGAFALELSFVLWLLEDRHLDLLLAFSCH